ncbi:hypothetical protein DFJ73DRAFT_145156 [Zopfochytrium polystomum]|nr:hypothetical protein DFJ73DRAFT_145156 [Zopfochytrium polystomum]
MILRQRFPAARQLPGVAAPLRGSSSLPHALKTSFTAVYDQVALAQQSRSYAAPAFTESEVRMALARARRTIGDNLAPTTQIYFYEIYRRIIASRNIFIFQNNNMTAADYSLARREFRAAGFTVSAIRNALFRAAIRHHERDLLAAKLMSEGAPLPPALKAELEDPRSVRLARDTVTGKVSRRLTAFEIDERLGLMPLQNALVGPCVAIFSDAEDGRGSGERILDRVLLAAGKPYAKKMMLVGGAIERQTFSPEQLVEVSKLPTKARLREELVGLLSSPAATLTDILEQNPKSLILSLQAREKQVADDESARQ